MSKIPLIMTAILANLVIIYFTGSYFANRSTDKLTSQRDEQSILIVENSKKIKSLFKKLDSVKNFPQPLQAKSQQPNNADIRKDILELATELNLLKKQLLAINTLEAQPTNTDESKFLPDGAQYSAPPPTTEVRQAMSKQEVIRTQQTYEAFLQEGAIDEVWADEITEVITNSINSNQLGNNISLDDISCTTKMCKAHLIYASNEKLQLRNLSVELNFGGMATDEREDVTTGQKETILYLTKPGIKLPLVNSK